MPRFSDDWADEILERVFADKSGTWRPIYWRKNPAYWSSFGGKWYPNHTPKNGWGSKPPVEHLFEIRQRGYK